MTDGPSKMPYGASDRASFQRQDIARNAHNAQRETCRSAALFDRFKDRDALHMMRHQEGIGRNAKHSPSQQYATATVPVTTSRLQVLDSGEPEYDGAHEGCCSPS